MPCGCRPGRIKNATRSQTPRAANARRNVHVDRVDPLATTFALRQLPKVGWARLFRFLTLRPDNIYSGRESFAVSPLHLSLSRSASKRVRADLVRSRFARQVFRHRSLLRARLVHRDLDPAMATSPRAAEHRIVDAALTNRVCRYLVQIHGVTTGDQKSCNGTGHHPGEWL